MKDTVFAPMADQSLSELPAAFAAANALADEVQANADAVAANAASAAASQAAASGSQAAAADSAATALAAPNTSGTSASNLLIGLGVQNFVTQPGKAFAAGQQVVAVSNASPANYMLGTVTGYVSGTGALTLNVTSVRGAGTFADWTLSFLGALPPPATAGLEVVSDGASWVAGASAFACLAIWNTFTH